MSDIHIYTDGSCLGNPGPGGWAALVIDEGQETILQGCEEQTTNNRMELMAAIEALRQLPAGKAVVLTTDSDYLRQGITTWIHNWKKNGWRTANKKPVKNVDLWQALEQQAAAHQVQWEWVKAHNGHVYNERVDQLAREAIQL